MKYKCEKCRDTGSRDKSGDCLDCGHCEAAMQRKAMNDFLDKLPAMGDYDAAWLVHQRAFSMAADHFNDAVKMVPAEDCNCEAVGYAKGWNARRAAAPMQAQEPIYQARSPEETAWQDIDRVTYDHASANGFEVRSVYRAPVQPVAVPDGVVEPTYMTEEQARDWAWKDVKKDVGTSGWTAGDNGNYFGFFVHGWNYRGQFEKQRRAAPAAQGDAETDALIVRLVNLWDAQHVSEEDYNDEMFHIEALMRDRRAAIAAKAAS